MSESFDTQSFKLPERLTLNPDQLQAIGSVITEWAKAEQTLFIATFSVFGGMPGSGIGIQHALTAWLASGMNAKTTGGLLKGFVSVGAPEHAEEFERAVDAILREGKRRDIVAHAVWRKGERPDSLATMSLRSVGSFRVQRNEFTAAELIRLANRIRRARYDLVRLLMRLGYVKQPSPDKSEEPIP